MLRRISWFLFWLFSSSAAAFSQSAAPYVTRLQVQSDVKQVLVTWKDAEGYEGSQYEIWRSKVEITKDTLSQAALIATVKSGVEQYEDKKVDSPSYYLVLMRDKSGTRQDYFIPFRNKSVLPVGLLSTDDGQMAQITALNAVALGKQIIVRFTSKPPERKLMVFRTVKPVQSLTDLKDATLLGQIAGIEGSYKDTPPPGLDFYYTVIDALAFSDGVSNVLGPNNTTTKPAGLPLVELPKEAQSETLDPKLRPQEKDILRPLPLPSIKLDKDPVTGESLPPSALKPIPAEKLSPEAQKVLSDVTKGSSEQRYPLPDPFLFAEEKAQSPQGSEKLLARIVQTYFLGKEWAQTVNQLRTFLKLELDTKLQARARFYLGQSLAYLKDYKNALLEITMAREFYHVETESFLNSLLSLLEAPSQPST